VVIDICCIPQYILYNVVIPYIVDVGNSVAILPQICTSTEEVVFSLTSVDLICLFVSRFMQNVLHRFSQNLVEI